MLGLLGSGRKDPGHGRNCCLEPLGTPARRLAGVRPVAPRAAGPYAEAGLGGPVVLGPLLPEPRPSASALTLPCLCPQETLTQQRVSFH